MKQLVIAFSLCIFFSMGLFAAVKIKPHVYPAQCVGCGDCTRICPVKGKAIFLVQGKAILDLEKCIGCKKCVFICSYGAVK